MPPDRRRVDELPGFYLASGFMGHGFMMAPIIGQLLALAIAEDHRARPSSKGIDCPALGPGPGPTARTHDHRLRSRLNASASRMFSFR
jgi:hypothetical protein